MGKQKHCVRLNLSFVLIFVALFPVSVPRALAIAPVRPLVLLFPVVVATSNARDEVAAAREKSSLATQAVRDHLNESGIVDSIIYVPDSPTFERALHEMHISVNGNVTPGEEQRLAIAKAIGANYLVLVLCPPVTAGSDVQLESTDTRTQRVWKDRAHSDISASAAVSASGSRLRYSNSLNSAANTVVQRFLGGPLRDFNKASLSPDLAPPVVPPTQDVLPLEREITDSTSEAKAVREQGEALLTAGDVNGAIVMLRRAVNRAPLSAAPRAALTRAYLSAHRGSEAASEAKRGLMVLPLTNRKDRVEMTRLLTEAINQNGDPSAARATYEQIIAAQPRALWARLALADLYVRQNRTDQAEQQYRAVFLSDPQNREALEGLSHILVERGDYSNALKQMAGANADAATRSIAARTLFDEGTLRLSDTVIRNRKAWENDKLSREIFYKATQSQAQRANALLRILRGAAPPATNANSVSRGAPVPNSTKTYRQRVLAGSLLAQSLASLLSFLETGEVGAGTKATLLMNEFQKELNSARAELGEKPDISEN